ncbi:MAG TPA: HEAT repeat domain-containing protein [Methanoregulaceae archaeon]|nr:HEAT repeat domain-containing protein [Methanoregulaceae archaeon]
MADMAIQMEPFIYILDPSIHIRDIMAGTPEHIQELVNDLKNKNENIRWGAAFALVKIGEPTVESLIHALDDPDSIVRLRAAWALGIIRDGRALRPLISALRDGDWSVRMRASDALGELMDNSAVEPLISLFRDENENVRRHAVMAISKIGDKSALPKLEVVLRDADWRVRMAVVMTFALWDGTIPQNLKALALNDKNDDVKRIAKSILKE